MSELSNKAYLRKTHLTEIIHLYILPTTNRQGLSTSKIMLDIFSPEGDFLYQSGDGYPINYTNHFTYHQQHSNYKFVEFKGSDGSWGNLDTSDNNVAPVCEIIKGW